VTPAEEERRDPTAVLGRRTLAWLFDVLLFAAAFLVPVAVFGQVFRGADIAAQPGGFRFVDGDATLWFRSRVLVVPGDKFWLAVGLTVVVFLASWIVVQGLRGVTPGKGLFRVRCVTRERPTPGIGRALLRTVLWVVDLITIVLPIGFILATFTRGHRRVGDFVASTFVVDRAYARRLAERTGAPVPAEGEPRPEPEPAPTPVVAAAGTQDLPRLRDLEERSTEPVWDDDLDTYVRWEPTVEKWIGWDESAQKWTIVERRAP
jgi:uncharacterized RDD family membrane protein YckC